MSPPSPSFLLFELKLINFCRILAIGLGYKKSLKYLKVIWLGKNGFETWRQSVIILCLKALLGKLLSSVQSVQCPVFKAQDLGSLKRLLPACTPISRASLQAFCM